MAALSARIFVSEVTSSKQLYDLADLVGTRLQRLQLARNFGDGRLLVRYAFGDQLIGARERFPRSTGVWVALSAIWLACPLSASSIWLSAEARGASVGVATPRAP